MECLQLEVLLVESIQNRHCLVLVFAWQFFFTCPAPKEAYFGSSNALKWPNQLPEPPTVSQCYANKHMQTNIWWWCLLCSGEAKLLQPLTTERSPTAQPNQPNQTNQTKPTKPTKPNKTKQNKQNKTNKTKQKQQKQPQTQKTKNKITYYKTEYQHNNHIIITNKKITVSISPRLA